MNTFLKFVGGLALGAAIGVGVYLVVTKESEEGLIHDIKENINKAIEAGRLAAEERRRQLEQELGFSIEDEPVVTQPAQRQALPQQTPPAPQP